MSKFTDYTHLLTLLKQAYGLEFVSIASPESGYRNLNYKLTTRQGENYNLIVYKQESQIQRRISQANYVSDFLAEADFPTRQAIPAVNGHRLLRLTTNQTGRYACLYNYLPGVTIPWDSYTQKHVKLLGLTLGKMHTVLAGLETASSFSKATTELTSQLTEMEEYWKSSGVTIAMRLKLRLQLQAGIFQNFRRHLTLAAADKQQLPLHLDFVRSNILFSGKGESLHISGILDFEKTAKGPVVLDLARSLAFLIVDCKYKPEAKVRKYFLQSGYVKRGGGSLPSLSQLDVWLNYFWLYDFYKFLRHNPYESLQENEHYRRAVEKLLEQSLVESV